MKRFIKNQIKDQATDYAVDKAKEVVVDNMGNPIYNPFKIELTTNKKFKDGIEVFDSVNFFIKILKGIFKIFQAIFRGIRWIFCTWIYSPYEREMLDNQRQIIESLNNNKKMTE